MKKIIAIAMALVMMMAIAVPAFAAIEGGSNAGNDTIINTLTKKEDGTQLLFLQLRKSIGKQQQQLSNTKSTASLQQATL